MSSVRNDSFSPNFRKKRIPTTEINANPSSDCTYVSSATTPTKSSKIVHVGSFSPKFKKSSSNFGTILITSQTLSPSQETTMQNNDNFQGGNTRTEQNRLQALERMKARKKLQIDNNNSTPKAQGEYLNLKCKWKYFEWKNVCTQSMSFGVRNNGKVLIADDMGLGKTIEAIGLCSYYKDDWPILVICPSSMKTSWLQHFICWIPSITEGDVNIIQKSKNYTSTGKVTIVSYDLATKLATQIKQRKFNIIIADESHFLKNHQAARTKTLVPILQSAKRSILLSGTPALSRPKELFMQIKALSKNMFPKYKDFSIRYCDGKEGRYGWDDTGSANTDELNHLLRSTIMIRRLKEDVLQQLPEKRRQFVMLDPSFVKQTKELKLNERSFVSSAKRERRTSLMHYYDSTCDAKLKGVCKYISEQLESRKKIVVFAHHLKMLDGIEAMAEIKNVAHIRIDGKTNSTNRQSLIDEFTSNKDCLLAILSITAAGTGLNITTSSFVIFAELYWNPGHLIQAEDRTYRYGQKNAVVINYLVARQTADDYLWPMIKDKLQVLGDLGVGMTKCFGGEISSFTDPNQRSIKEFFAELNQREDGDDVVNEPTAKRIRQDVATTNSKNAF